MKDPKTNPIGVFDSGVGGVTVLRELVRLMPAEDYLFLGDSAHAPYGTKSPEEVLALSRQNVDRLLSRGAKEIVVACNTATAVGIDALRRLYPDVPVIGIEPALKPAALENEGKRVLLMATPLTLNLERVAMLRQRFENVARVEILPCRGLAELIEAGHLDDEALDAYLAGLFSGVDRESVSAVVLGCTHYPHILPALARRFPPAVRFYDGGAGTARRARDVLRERDLLRPEGGRGTVEFFSTDPSPAALQRAKALLDRSLSQ
ncbi:MAG: glutamate racemase [Clostridia bacterium]|nr:glutamate racemase [Clostridia bacterium]